MIRNLRLIILIEFGIIALVCCSLDDKFSDSSDSSEEVKEQEPEFLLGSKNYTAYAGTDVKLECSVKNIGKFKIVWVYNETRLLTVNTNVITINPHISVTREDYEDEIQTWFLHISNVSREDEGNYSCNMGDKTGRMKSQGNSLNVLVPPEIVISETSPDKVVREGTSFDLRCRANGNPQPSIKWRRLENDKKIKINGTLSVDEWEGYFLDFINVSREEGGNYICIASNGVPPSASETITLTVLFPLPAPQVIVDTATEDSITVKLIPPEIGNASGFFLHYRSEFGGWKAIYFRNIAQEYTFMNLYCGAFYQVYTIASSPYGDGEQSEIYNLTTKGSKPILPEKSSYIKVSSRSVTLILTEWQDGGCPMFYFIVEIRKKDRTEWNLITNNARPDKNFSILDLEPASSYMLRVIAQNGAGFTVGEYEFTTLSVNKEVPASAYHTKSNKYLIALYIIFCILKYQF